MTTLLNKGCARRAPVRLSLIQPRQVGTEWNPAMRDLPRGAWPVCGEADHGLVAGIEAACTVLCVDPVFGLVASGAK